MAFLVVSARAEVCTVLRMCFLQVPAWEPSLKLAIAEYPATYLLGFRWYVIPRARPLPLLCHAVQLIAAFEAMQVGRSTRPWSEPVAAIASALSGVAGLLAVWWVKITINSAVDAGKASTNVELQRQDRKHTAATDALLSQLATVSASALASSNLIAGNQLQLQTAQTKRIDSVYTKVDKVSNDSKDFKTELGIQDFRLSAVEDAVPRISALEEAVKELQKEKEQRKKEEQRKQEHQRKKERQRKRKKEKEEQRKKGFWWWW